jgi:single-strand DNA-binding protein
MYINKALLYGNLTRDPELRSTPSGTKVCSFGMATNRTWKDQNGAKQESTEFHNIVAFGKQAEVIAQYLKKGQAIYVDGRIQTRSWDDKNSGEKKYRTEIVIENFQFGPKSSGGGSYDGAAAGAAVAGGSAVKSKQPELETIEYPADDINPDDIPF